jgi:hypothetical protein
MTRTECAIIQPQKKTAHHWKGAVQRYAKPEEKATVLVYLTIVCTHTYIYIYIHGNDNSGG